MGYSTSPMTLAANGARFRPRHHSVRLPAEGNFPTAPGMR